MNIEYNLVLIKGDDKTEKIVSCDLEDQIYYVRYKNDNEIHKYPFTDVRWFDYSVKLNISKTVIPSSVCRSDVTKILRFDEYKKIFLNNGYVKLCNENNVIVDNKNLNNKWNLEDKKSFNCFKYLKELSTVVGIVDNENITLLSKQYDRINQVNSKSILSYYLDFKLFQRLNAFERIQPIFPFGFNLSQKDATQKALEQRISIVEGPPGTGKTQTILNIIANAVINGKTVAVVSNNDAATLNVQEKLEKYAVSFITAYLGKSTNKTKFLDNQSGLYPNMEEWKMSLEDISNMKSELILLGRKLDKSLELENAIARIKSEINEYVTEKIHFDNYYNEKCKEAIPDKSIAKLDSDKLMNMMIEYRTKIEKSKKIKFIDKLIWFIRYGMYNFKFYDNSCDSIVSLFEKKYYEEKIEELKSKKTDLELKLKELNFNSNMSEYTDSSMKLFKSCLYNRYNKKEREIFTKKDLFHDSENFVKEYPVIFSTTYSLKYCLKEDYLYDYVIIDESSQVDILTGALTLSCAKNIVVVGDLKQLPNVVTKDEKIITDEIYNKYDLKEAYKYSENSILSSVLKVFPNVPRTLLKEHYRCNPLIIGFCNKKFYNNELIVLTKSDENGEPLVVYKTVEGNHGRGMTNQRQIDVISNEILNDEKNCTANDCIGIISPYRMQAEELKKLMITDNIQADTVHKFQGREKDVIIISTVANEINDFVDNSNLINVAVSRAINKLIVVVSANEEDSKNTNIRRFNKIH